MRWVIGTVLLFDRSADNALLYSEIWLDESKDVGVMQGGK
jgi:hypothetical protein